MHEKATVGVIGCGVISQEYLRNLTTVFEDVEVLAVSDVIHERAKDRAEQFGIPTAYSSSEELLADPEIQVVVNLTLPAHHAAVSKAALTAGKHVYSEKPMATSRQDAAELIRMAKDRGLLLGGAPDTFLGAGFQTCRKLIDDGWIGTPFGAIGQFLRGGPESWHPNPAFLYQQGAGPIFDMGPYFAAVCSYLLGPVASVTCSGLSPVAERTITSEPLRGQTVRVEVPTFVAAQLNFARGGTASIVISEDIASTQMFAPDQQLDPAQMKGRAAGAGMEIYGTEGTLVCPSPTEFGGPIYYKRTGMHDWAEVPSLYPYTGDLRGLGVAELANAALHGRSPRVTPEMAYHSLDVVISLDESWKTGSKIAVESTFADPGTFSSRLRLGQVDPGPEPAPPAGNLWNAVRSE